MLYYSIKNITIQKSILHKTNPHQIIVFLRRFSANIPFLMKQSLHFINRPKLLHYCLLKTSISTVWISQNISTTHFQSQQKRYIWMCQRERFLYACNVVPASWEVLSTSNFQFSIRRFIYICKCMTWLSLCIICIASVKRKHDPLWHVFWWTLTRLLLAKVIITIH